MAAADIWASAPGRTSRASVCFSSLAVHRQSSAAESLPSSQEWRAGALCRLLTTKARQARRCALPCRPPLCVLLPAAHGDSGQLVARGTAWRDGTVSISTSDAEAADTSCRLHTLSLHRSSLGRSAKMPMAMSAVGGSLRAIPREHVACKITARWQACPAACCYGRRTHRAQRRAHSHKVRAMATAAAGPGVCAATTSTAALAFAL